MGFHFSNLILYEHALKSKSARGRDSLVSEMIRHSTAILHLPMDTVDQHTRHLSDHIYHMITFAAIVICRLLSSYETQLAATYNIAELDTLICNLVQWLHGIGLPCHAAYTLANIIAKELFDRVALIMPPFSSEILFSKENTLKEALDQVTDMHQLVSAVNC
ncbi:unnamed protein product [Penicillium pancosmium]